MAKYNVMTKFMDTPEYKALKDRMIDRHGKLWANIVDVRAKYHGYIESVIKLYGLDKAWRHDKAEKKLIAYAENPDESSTGRELTELLVKQGATDVEIAEIKKQLVEKYKVLNTVREEDKRDGTELVCLIGVAEAFDKAYIALEATDNRELRANIDGIEENLRDLLNKYVAMFDEVYLKNK